MRWGGEERWGGGGRDGEGKSDGLVGGDREERKRGKGEEMRRGGKMGKEDKGRKGDGEMRGGCGRERGLYEGKEKRGKGYCEDGKREEV